jgi:hypothetical protein
MGGVSNKTTSHITRVSDLTYFSRSQRSNSKFPKNYESWRILLLFDLECSNLVWICICTPSTYTQNFGLIGFQNAVRPGGHLGKSTKSYYSWTNGWIISKFLSYVHLIRIHDIIPRFLIWPTFQGHRGQSSKQIMKLTYFVTIWPGKI